MKLRRLLAGSLAAALAAVCTAIPASAHVADSYTIDAGIFGVTNAQFTAEDGGQVLLAGDEDQGFFYVMDIPGPGPTDAGYQTSLEQNGDLWSQIDEITVKFKVNTTSDPDIDDFSGFYLMTFLQLGGDAGWAWLDSGAAKDITNIDPDYNTSEEGFQFGQEYTAVYHPKAAMTLKNQAAGTKGGVLKMGIAVGNNGVDSLDFSIEFTDVQVKGDQATIDQYTTLAKELTGRTAAAPVVTEAPAATEAPAETTAGTTAPATDKGSPDTGVAGVAAVVGVAVIAAGAVAVSRKRK